MEDLTEPKTYWEKRCAINEHYLDNILEMMCAALPHLKYQMFQLNQRWDEAIEKLDIEFTVH